MNSVRRNIARTRGLLPLAAVLPAVTLISAISAGPAAARDAGDSPALHGSAKPTVVLVHGAWADASGWSEVISSLQAQGYPVIATANPLRSLSGDSAYLAARLKTINGPVILVGHSYGGAVITNAAAGNPNVKSLVYIAGFAPDKGETTGELAAKFPGSQLTDDPNAPLPTALSAVPLGGGPTDVDLYLKPEKFNNVFLSNRVDAARAAVLAAAQRPLNATTNVQPTEAVAWKTIPSWYLVADDDRTIGTENLRFMAKRAGSTTVEVDAPHDVMETNSDAVTELILQAAHGSRPSLAHTGSGRQAAVLGGAAALALGSGMLLVTRSRRGSRS
ncbi:alpha/beta fold hydrolase [Streptomyces fructofermentans]|uniref:Alpha/beta hydrolase n=1 Tax=Streptomyces fructofermentans TaxID=152141 RepID=A0A918U596_9ACTN|nr:alpha/beta hydrolase [Streptomyces fructofermentans]GGX93902.1 alpha/beta hydrolase [Streptomyces fructofermentans]